LLAAHIGRLRTQLVLLQNLNNLLFGKSFALQGFPAKMAASLL
jgi:hypothetical protein